MLAHFPQTHRKRWAAIWVWCFFSFPFMLFLCEEGSQVLSFGRYILVSGGLFEDAREAIRFDRKFNQVNLVLSYISIPGNPISAFIFIRYFRAEKEKLRREEKRACSELGLAVPAPPPPMRVSRLSVRLVTLCLVICLVVVLAPVKLPRRRRKVPALEVRPSSIEAVEESLRAMGYSPAEIESFKDQFIHGGKENEV